MVDPHQSFRNAHQVRVPAWDHSADGYVKIDAANAGSAATVDDGVADLAALPLVERNDSGIRVSFVFRPDASWSGFGTGR